MTLADYWGRSCYNIKRSTKAIYIYIYIYVCVWLLASGFHNVSCIYIYMYVYIYMCVYVHMTTYIHTYARTLCHGSYSDPYMQDRQASC